ncbi:jacalin-like lectin domain-containing protein,MAC/perforin domain-containing protein [Leptolyngbya sp. PCC 7375]|nr:jacalin-like lectin domain-containing protein,MAC/perforin domain-containing protein [Leptolyngbya sp. PCC 7375]
MYKRWRVYSTFLTGILIGFVYAVLISDKLTSTSTNIPLFLLIERPVLILVFSGILGGVIYTIMVDGYVSMPRFVANQGNQFEAGLFGDILLGIAGAFILEFLLPANLPSLGQPELSNTAIAATGIMGGYGGRAILKFGLERLFKNLDPSELSPTRSKEARRDVDEVGIDSPDKGLQIIDQVDLYIKDDLSEDGWDSLSQAIQNASTPVKQQLFEVLVNLKKLGALTSTQLRRMGSIFEALIQSDPNHHRYYGQLALIYKDTVPPDYLTALACLDKAIALRGALRIGQPWDYELNRAVVRIQQAHKTTKSFEFVAHLQDAIIADLLTIARIYNLDTILQGVEAHQSSTPVLAWMQHNQAFLAARQDTQALVAPLIIPEKPQSQPPVPRQPRPPAQPPQLPIQLPTETTPTNDGTALAPVSHDLTVPENPDGWIFPEIYSALGKCYDILDLDPFDISGTAKKHRVFHFYPGEAIEIRDEVLKLKPRGTRYITGSRGSLSASAQTKVLYTESDVQQLFSSDLGGVVTRFVGMFVPFSLSASYGKFKHERTYERSIYAFTQAEYIDYALEMILGVPGDLHLDEEFRRAVEHLPVQNNELAYLEFIDDFGTHVSSQVKFGGLVHHRIRLNQSTYAAVVQRGANLETEAKKIFKASYSRGAQGTTYREIQEHSEAFEFCGGMANQNLYDWFDTVKDDPAPIKLTLMPLDELLNPQFFPQDPAIQQKQTLMAAVIETYLKKNSEKPAWELWPSVAIGGWGGEPFSDIDLEPNMLAFNQSRYQNAQVLEVKVWFGAWIEQIQMVLDSDALPLPAHGSGADKQKTFRLDPGDYITAVYVTTISPRTLVITGGPYVASLEIRTHQGHRWTVGDPKDQAIALDIPDGYQVIGFHGRSGKYIDRLGVISIPAAEN